MKLHLKKRFTYTACSVFSVKVDAGKLDKTEIKVALACQPNIAIDSSLSAVT